MKTLIIWTLLLMVVAFSACQNESVYFESSEVVCSTGAVLVNGNECIGDPQLQEQEAKPPRFVSFVGSIDQVISRHTMMEQFTMISDDGGEVLNTISVHFQRDFWLDQGIEGVNFWITDSPFWQSDELSERVYPELDYCIKYDNDQDGCIWKDVEVSLNYTLRKGVNVFYIWMDTSNFQSEDILNFKVIEYEIDELKNGCNPYYRESGYGISCFYRQLTLH